MGWYLRKSFGIGPIRLNLSKSGLGVSAGVKGLRIGTGPRGSYVHGGREGLYYRQSLETRPTQADPGQAVVSDDAGFAAIEPGDAEVKKAKETFWSAFWRGIFGGLMRGR